jgi:hypothetical protein
MAASNNYCDYTSLNDYSKNNSGSGNTQLSYMSLSSKSNPLRNIAQPLAYPKYSHMQKNRVSSFQSGIPTGELRRAEFGGPGYPVTGYQGSYQSHNYFPGHVDGLERPSRISMFGMDGTDDGETTSETRTRELSEQEAGIKARDAMIARQQEADRKARIAADMEADKQRRVAERAEQAELARQARLADQARQAREAKIAEKARLDEMARRDEQSRLAEQARLAEIRMQKKQIADRQAALERKEKMRLAENERRRLVDRCSGYDQLDNAYATNMW